LVLDRIIDKVLPFEENRPLIQVALIVAVCTTLLNPKYERIQLSEKIMKDKVAHFLISFCNLFIQIMIILILISFHFLKSKLEANDSIGLDDDYCSEDDNE